MATGRAGRRDPSRFRTVRDYFRRVFLDVVWWDFVLNRRGLRAFRGEPVRRLAAKFRGIALELGGVLIKLGQFLSVRVDVLPQFVRAGIVMMAASSLSGCLFDRVMTVRGQMCGDEDLIEITNGDGLQVTFNEPVLYDDDVTLMLGVSPFHTEADGDRLEMRYLVRKPPVYGEPDWIIPVDLSFERVDGKYKLQGLSVESDLPVGVDAERLEQMTSASCSALPSVWRRSIQIPMRPEDLAMAPTRAEVLSLAGTPTRANADLTEIHYELTIRGSADDQGSAAIAMYFDTRGETLIRIESSFLRFRMDADFETGIASARVGI